MKKKKQVKRKSFRKIKKPKIKYKGRKPSNKNKTSKIKKLIRLALKRKKKR